MIDIRSWQAPTSKQPEWSRVFVQTEAYATHGRGARARWIELQMTDHFLDQIQHLITLLTQENLVSLTVLLSLNWDVNPHWEILGDTEAVISDSMIEFTASAIPKNWPPASSLRRPSHNPLILHHHVRAVFIFGAVEALMKEHRHVAGVAACDRAETHSLLRGFDPTQYDEAIGRQMGASAHSQFIKTVNSYLQEKGMPLLRGDSWA